MSMGGVQVIANANDAFALFRLLAEPEVAAAMLRQLVAAKAAADNQIEEASKVSVALFARQAETAKQENAAAAAAEKWAADKEALALDREKFSRSVNEINTKIALESSAVAVREAACVARTNSQDRREAAIAARETAAAVAEAAAEKKRVEAEVALAEMGAVLKKRS